MKTGQPAVYLLLIVPWDTIEEQYPQIPVAKVC